MATASSKKVRENSKDSDLREQARDLARESARERTQNSVKSTQTSTTGSDAKKSTDHIRITIDMVTKFVSVVYNLIYTVLLPTLLNTYNIHIAPKIYSAGSVNQSTKTKSIRSLDEGVKGLKNLDMSLIRNNIGYLFLAFELYSIMFHSLIVRCWLIANFVATFLYMYDTLSEPRVCDRFIPIGTQEIKKYSSVVVGLGVILLLFFTSTVGFFTVPLILYLINRTTKNVFGRGF